MVLIGVSVLMPLMYCATVLEIELVFGRGQGLGAFWVGFARRGFGPSGPLWFIGVLLINDLLSSVFHRVVPRKRAISDKQKVAVLDNPRFFAKVPFGSALVSYLLMTMLFTRGVHGPRCHIAITSIFPAPCSQAGQLGRIEL